MNFQPVIFYTIFTCFICFYPRLLVTDSSQHVLSEWTCLSRYSPLKVENPICLNCSCVTSPLLTLQRSRVATVTIGVVVTDALKIRSHLFVCGKGCQSQRVSVTGCVKLGCWGFCKVLETYGATLQTFGKDKSFKMQTSLSRKSSFD